MSALTDKQAAFVDEYLVDLCATAAAERAGYSDPNYGRQLITKPNVKKKLAERRKEQEQRTNITADMVLERLWHEGNEADSDSARVSALQAVGKHLGMFVDKVENSGTQRIIVEYVEAD